MENEFITTWNIFKYDIYINIDVKSYIEQQIILKKGYSENINFHIFKNIRPNTILLDIGSNIGTTSLPTATAFPSVDVHCFEPNLEINNKLKENAELNFLDNVYIYDWGISNKSSVKTLFYSGEKFGNRGTSSLHKNDDILNPQEIEIPLRTVDDLYAECLKPISVIKIDVQGHEIEVLEGAIKTIQKFNPIIIFEHEDRYQRQPTKRKDSLQNFFKKANYKVFEIDRYDHRVLRFVYWNEDINANLIALPIRNQNNFLA